MDAARYLEDGKLTIFRRWGTFYAPIRIAASDKYIWRSLKTSDEQTAKRPDKLLTKRRGENLAGRLLAMPDESRIITLIDQLDAALKEAGIQRNSFGEKYANCSFRHFYAVNALRNGVGVFEVARNMGTPVQIIQEYYGKQASPTVFATRLGD